MTTTTSQRVLLYLLIILSLSGCATTPYTLLSPGITAQLSIPVERNTPFAPDPKGGRVALVQNGLHLVDVGSGKKHRLSEEAPKHLAWSADGARLAATYGKGGESRVEIYDNKGQPVASCTISGGSSGLVWRNGELLIGTVALKVYSFGANLKQLLYRWDGTNPPARMELHDATVRPRIYKGREAEVPRLFTFFLSPYGDMILYSRISDPPAFQPYLRFIMRNLATGSQREVASASLASGGAVPAGPDDVILYGDGSGETWLRDPWQEKDLARYPHPGHSLAGSGGGKTILIDGRLYHAGKVVGEFAADAAGRFTADGTRLFISQGERLVMISPLPPDPLPSPVGDPERFLMLRQWRMDGLITPSDFQNQLQRMLHE